MKKTITYREALSEGLRYAFQNDARVFMMGEDIGKYGGPYGVTKGFIDEFGEDRIRDAPLAESGFTGAGIGAALNGMRPIVEIMTVNFSLLALDQIINTAASLRHMSGGQFSVPIVIRMTTGAGRQLAAQHSHSFEGWYAHIPGIRIVAPSNAHDARGMLWSALKDPDPVLIFEHALLFQETQEIDAAFVAADLDRAAILREGQDVTLICYGGMVPRTLKAAAELETAGISAEVIDLRTLRPLDRATILVSVNKTRRAVIVDEGWRSGSLSAEIAMTIVEGAFYELDAPIARVCSEEVPIPYAAHMEQAAIPQVEKIVAAVNQVVYG